MDWEHLANYGLPTLLLGFCLYGLRGMVLWAKTTVVEPIVKSHLELINTMKDNIPKQTLHAEETAKAAVSMAEKHAKELESQGEALEKIAKSNEKLCVAADTAQTIETECVSQLTEIKEELRIQTSAIVQLKGNS